MGDALNVAGTLNNLGIMADERRDHAAARELFAECVVIYRELGRPVDLLGALNNLGLSAYYQDDYATARDCFTEVLALPRDECDAVTTAMAQANLALTACAQGDFAAARAAYREGLPIARDLENWECSALLLEGLAGLAMEQDHPAQLLQFLGAAQALRDAMTAPMPPVGVEWLERMLGFAETRLGPATLAAALLEGRTAPINTVLDAALDYVAEPPGRDGSAVADRTAPPLQTPSPAEQRTAVLSVREREVLSLVAEGLSNKQIAARLVLSPLTVRTHLTSICGKLKVASRTAAVHVARREGEL
jgi:non-specific serine/threonine protein kinase